MTESLTKGLFDRDVELVVQGKQRDSQGRETGSTQAFSIRDLTIQFRVQKFPSSLVDNRAEIRVYNLRSTVRALLSKRKIDHREAPFTTIFLSAGYKRGPGAGLIFRGVVVKGENLREGPDWVSNFEAYTAHQQASNAMVEPSFSFGETPPLTIANRLFDALQFGTPRYSTEAQVILGTARPVRIALTGRVDRALTVLLARYNLVYTLDDDGPFVVRVGSASNTEVPVTSIPVISPKTGLIGTPKITDSGVELRTLLNPKLRVFHRFKLTSASTDESLSEQDRQFTLTKLEHFGSNRGEDFFSSVTGMFYPRVPFIAKPVEPPASYTINPVQIGAAP